MAEGNKAKTASAPAVAVLAFDTEYHEHIPTVLPFRPELKDVFAANDTMRNDTGRFSAALQAGYFLLAVRAHGLAAGPMGGFDAKALDADFFPDGRWQLDPGRQHRPPGRGPVVRPVAPSRRRRRRPLGLKPDWAGCDSLS